MRIIKIFMICMQLGLLWFLLTSVFELVLHNEPFHFFEFRKALAQLKVQENIDRNTKTLWVTYDANGMTQRSFKEISLKQFKDIFEPDKNVVIHYNSSHPEYFYIDGLKNSKTFYIAFFLFLSFNIFCLKFIQGISQRISRPAPRISREKDDG